MADVILSKDGKTKNVLQTDVSYWKKMGWKETRGLKTTEGTEGLRSFMPPKVGMSQGEGMPPKVGMPAKKKQGIKKNSKEKIGEEKRKLLLQLLKREQNMEGQKSLKQKLPYKPSKEMSQKIPMMSRSGRLEKIVNKYGKKGKGGYSNKSSLKPPVGKMY